VVGVRLKDHQTFILACASISGKANERDVVFLFFPPQSFFSADIPNRSLVMSARRILIVEDEQDVRVTMYHAFSGHGYEVTTAANAATALELLAQVQVDVALLDYRLPDMDGLDLYHRIKDRQPDLLCIFVTAYATVDMIEAALDAGVCRILPKPVDIPEILDAVEKLVGHGV